MLISIFNNPILKQFVIWTTIYIVVWVSVGVTIGCLLNPELTGTSSLTSSEENDLKSSARSFLVLSFVIDGVIIGLYCILPSIRKRDVSFVICLIAVDFVNMVARFASSFELENEAGCRTTATVLAYCSLSAVMWIYILSFYLYHRIIHNIPTNEFGRTKIAFHIFGWGAPILPVLFGLGFDLWGKAGAWCWVGHEYPAFRIFYYYLPMLETFIISAYCFTKIIMKIRTVVNEPTSTLKTSAHKRLSVYLVVFCIFNLWGLAFRISNIVNPNHYIMWLYYIHHSERALSGAWDGIIFGYAFWGEIRKLYFSSKVSIELPNYTADGMTPSRDSGKSIIENSSKASLPTTTTRSGSV